jgi:hypothetical protein
MPFPNEWVAGNRVDTQIEPRVHPAFSPDLRSLSQVRLLSPPLSITPYKKTSVEVLQNCRILGGQR